MIGQKLYMAVWADGHGEELADWELELLGLPTGLTEPDGWREYALERWGAEPREGERWPAGHKPFFWPKTNVPYKSRSAAQRRVDLINRWGGSAVVMECTPVWESVEAANARRAAARINSRIVKKRAELAALESQLGEQEPVSLADEVRVFNSIKPGV